MQLINAAINAFPYRGEYYLQRSALYGKAGNQASAADDANQAQSWFASHYKIQECLGLTMKGDVDSDDASMKQGIQQLTDLSAATAWTWYEPIWDLGLAYSEVDDEANAVQYLTKALAAAPARVKWQVQRDLNLARYELKKGVVIKDESNN